MRIACAPGAVDQGHDQHERAVPGKATCACLGNLKDATNQRHLSCYYARPCVLQMTWSRRHAFVFLFMVIEQRALAKRMLGWTSVTPTCRSLIPNCCLTAKKPQVSRSANHDFCQRRVMSISDFRKFPSPMWPHTPPPPTLSAGLMLLHIACVKPTAHQSKASFRVHLRGPLAGTKNDPKPRRQKTRNYSRYHFFVYGFLYHFWYP